MCDYVTTKCDILVCSEYTDDEQYMNCCEYVCLWRGHVCVHAHAWPLEAKCDPLVSFLRICHFGFWDKVTHLPVANYLTRLAGPGAPGISLLPPLQSWESRWWRTVHHLPVFYPDSGARTRILILEAAHSLQIFLFPTQYLNFYYVIKLIYQMISVNSVLQEWHWFPKKRMHARGARVAFVFVCF